MVASLGALVAVLTAVVLMVPAISMTKGDLICGLSEHVHSDACYEQVLACGQTEGEAHAHTADCYEQVLTCEIPEHEHSDACYEAEEPAPAAPSQQDASADAGEAAPADASSSEAPASGADATAEQPQPSAAPSASTPADEAPIAPASATDPQALESAPEADAASDPEDASFEAGDLSAAGKTYSVSVSYQEDAEIPQDSTLKVREIPEGSAEYNRYLKASLAELGANADEVTFARFFDITIKHDGKEIEPASTVGVKMEYDEPIDTEGGKLVDVVHFADDGPEVIDTVLLKENNTEIVYGQDSFSVTGTIVTQPSNGSQYLMMVNYKGSYYIINNDGSLTLVNNPAAGKVEVEEPMTWTYTGSNIYHNTLQVGFNANQVASDYYRRYIDPTSATGITTESADDGKTTTTMRTEFNYFTWSNDRYPVVSSRPLQTQSALTYDSGAFHIKSNSGEQYLGVQEVNGVPTLVGGLSANDERVATIVMAQPDVLGNSYLNHTVNHIDISIEGKAGIDVPLAYGKYYNAAGEEILNVVEAKSLHLEKTGVGISADDMKRATITAYTKDANGVAHEVDNAFTISGYSANAATAWSTPQVRIEGVFKTADIPAVTQSYYNNNRNKVYQDRLDNRIWYSVTAIKTLTFDLVDPDVGQLCDADGNALTLTVDVAFSASFNYWDPGNECPPIQGSADWKRGWIYDWTDVSGMDFVLGGNPDDVNSNIYAIEITKMVVDEQGNRIKSATPITNSFTINRAAKGDAENADKVKDLGNETYNRGNYTALHEKKIRVGEDGLGLVYDYDVDEGMYYITEDPESIPQTVTDKTGNVWEYKETRLATEYAWRDSANDGKMHESATFTYKVEGEKVVPYVVGEDGELAAADAASQTGSFASMPEILGTYKSFDGTATHRNGFLEFFVYNVYESPKVNVPVIKTWKQFEGEGYDWEATFDLQWAPVYEGEASDGAAAKPADNFRNVSPAKTITVTKAQMALAQAALDAQKKGNNPTDEQQAALDALTFEGLPKYGTDASGNTYRIQYSLEETSYKVWQLASGATEANHESDTPTWSWSEKGGYVYKGSSNGDAEDDESEWEFRPFYLHDAGELNADDADYEAGIQVANAKKNVTASVPLSFTLQKKWDESVDELKGAADCEDTYAEFELRRYMHTEYRDLSHLTPDDLEANPITVTLKDQHGNVVSSISVQPHTGLYLTATFAAHQSGKSVTFTPEGGQAGASGITITQTRDNAANELIRSAEFFPEQDVTYVMGESGALADGDNGASVTDTNWGTDPVPDPAFSRTVRLSKADGWAHTFDDLVLVETSSGDDDGNEVVTVYGYYLVETDSNPEALAKFFREEGSGGQATQVPSGDVDHRIYNEQTVTALNGQNNRLKVQKEWRGVADTTGYPTVKFTLYQGWLSGDGKSVSINDGESWKYVSGAKNVNDAKNGEATYTGIELSAANDFTWVCPEQLPETLSDGTTNSRKVGYYIVEEKTSGSSGKASWKFYYYTGDNGTPDNPADDTQTNAANQPGGGGISGAAANEGGTLTVVNQMGSYLQMDIKKQFFELGASNSWANTTADHKANAAVLKFQVIRAVKNAAGQWIDEQGAVVSEPAWSDYGDPLYGGYDQAGNAVFQNGGQNSFYLENAGGNWHFRIRDEQGGASNKDYDKIGLPASGYYVQDGKSVSVSYAYSFREVGVYQYVGTNADGTLELAPYQWDWFSSITPTRYVDSEGQHEYWSKAFAGQDGERIANFQASDLTITKEWAGEETDVDEVYVKIYRVREGADAPDFGSREAIQAYAAEHDDFDFTAVIARDVRDNKGWQHYLADTSDIDVDQGWLVIRRNDAGEWDVCSITVNNALLGSVDASSKAASEYTYYLEEVGYGKRDANGALTEQKTVYDAAGAADVAKFKPTYSKLQDGEWQLIGRDLSGESGVKLGSKGENQLEVTNTSGPQTHYTVVKKFEGGKYPTDGSTQVVVELQQRYQDANGTWTDWRSADSASPQAVTLPRPKPANKPDDFSFSGDWGSDAASIAWYGSESAWTYTWTGLDVAATLADDPDAPGAPQKADLYYRAVETSTPGWFNATIAPADQDGHKAIDDEATGDEAVAGNAAEHNDVTNAPTTYTVEVDKQWVGADGDWPADFKVGYQVWQNWHLVDASAKGSAAEFKLGKAFTSVELQGKTGELSSGAATAQISELPSYGMLTASAADVEAAAGRGVTLVEGTTYLVAYSYSVQETYVKKGEEQIDFAPQTVDATAKVTGEGDDATASTSEFAATLENILTDLTVKKQWLKDGESVSWPDGAVVDYRVEQVATYKPANGAAKQVATQVVLAKNNADIQKNYGLAYEPLTTTNAGTGVKVSNLPTSGIVTLDAEEASKLGLSEGSYPVTYAYQVVEDTEQSVAPAGGVYAYSAQTATPTGESRIAMLTNEYTNITVKKLWKRGNQEANGTFPEGYIVNWKVVQLASDGHKYDYYVGKSFDGIETVVTHGDDNRLTADNKTVTLNYLPTAGVNAAGKEVTYDYEVYELPAGSEAPSKYTFQTLHAEQEGGVYTLTNELTDVAAKKVWADKNGNKLDKAPDNAEVTLQLYASLTKPEDLVTVDKTIVLDQWVNVQGQATGAVAWTDKDAKVTGKLVSSDGAIERNFTLRHGSDWTAVVTGLPKGKTYSVQITGVEGLPENTKESVFVYSPAASDQPSDADVFHVQAKGRTTRNANVTINWDKTNFGDDEDASVTVKLQRNGQDTGKSITLTRKVDGKVQAKSTGVIEGIDFDNYDVVYDLGDGLELAEGQTVSTNNPTSAADSEDAQITATIGKKVGVKIQDNTVAFHLVPVSYTNNQNDWRVGFSNFYSIEYVKGEHWSGYQSGTQTKLDPMHKGSLDTDTDGTSYEDAVSKDKWYIAQLDVQHFDTIKLVVNAGSIVDKVDYSETSKYTRDESGAYTFAGSPTIIFKPDANGAVDVTIYGYGNTGTIAKASRMAPRGVAAVNASLNIDPDADAARALQIETVQVPSIAGEAKDFAIVVDASNLPEDAVKVGEPVVLDGTKDSVENPEWWTKWSDLPKTDAAGNEIHYYVVETKAKASDVKSMEPVYERDSDGTIIIKNKVDKDDPKAGTLEVTKEVIGVKNLDPDKTFQFSVRSVTTGKYLAQNTGSDAVKNPYIWVAANADGMPPSDDAWFSIKVDQRYVFNNLTVGNYVLKERTSSADGSDPREIAAYVISDESVTGTANSGLAIRANSEVSFAFQNKYEHETTDVAVTKAWQNANGSSDAPAGAKVSFALYAKVKGSKDEPKPVEGRNAIELDGAVDAFAADQTDGEDISWQAHWTSLRKYDDAGTEYEYTVRETTNGWKHYTVSYPDGGTSASSGQTITNSEQTSELNVTKSWTTAGKAKVFDEPQSVSFTVYQQVGSNEARVYTEYNGNGKGAITYTPAAGATAAAWSTETLLDLPTKVYDANADDGAGAWLDAKYYAVEDVPEGALFDVAYSANSGEPDADASKAAASQGTITIHNVDSTVNLTVLKNWDDSAKASWAGDDLDPSVPYSIDFKVQYRTGGRAWTDFDSVDDGDEPDAFVLVYSGGDEGQRAFSIEWYDKAGEGKVLSQTVEGNALALPAGYEYRVVETGYVVKVDQQDATKNIVNSVPLDGDGKPMAFEQNGTSEADGDRGNWKSSLVNQLDDLEISGTKTWLDQRESHQNPELVIVRTSAKPGAEPEVLRAREDSPTVYSDALTLAAAPGDAAVNLQPVWTSVGGKATYTYYGLPKYDTFGYAYTYAVHEADANHDAVADDGMVSVALGSYTAKEGEGDDAKDVSHDVVADYKVHETRAADDLGTDFANEEVGKLKVQKRWYDRAKPAEKTAITYQLQKLGADGKWAVVQERTLTGSGDATTWSEELTGLPLYHQIIRDAAGAAGPETAGRKTIELEPITYRIVEVKVGEKPVTYTLKGADSDQVVGGGAGGYLDERIPQATGKVEGTAWVVTNSGASVLATPQVEYDSKGKPAGEAPTTELMMTNDQDFVSIVGQKTWVTQMKSDELPTLTLHLYQRPYGAEAGTGEAAGVSETETTLLSGDQDKDKPGYIEWNKPADSDIGSGQPIVWTYRILNLPRVDSRTGVEYRYRIVEKVSDANADRFAASNVSTIGQDFDPNTGNVKQANFTNTEKTTVSVVKTWNHNGESDQPDDVSKLRVRLFQVGETAQELADRELYLTKDDDGVWKLTVDDLPKYYTSGATMGEYKYYFVEEDPALTTDADGKRVNPDALEGWWHAEYSANEAMADATTMGSRVQVSGAGTVYIKNTKYDKELPHTGGAGTVPVTAVGAVLALAGLALLLRSRRES